MLAAGQDRSASSSGSREAARAYRWAGMEERRCGFHQGCPGGGGPDGLVSRESARRLVAISDMVLSPFEQADQRAQAAAGVAPPIRAEAHSPAGPPPP